MESISLDSILKRIILFLLLVGIILGTLSQCQLEQGFYLTDPFGGPYICEVTVDPPPSVERSFKTYYSQFENYHQCILDEGERWFAKFPEQAEQIKQRYATIQENLPEVDLSNTPQAEQWLDAHPVDWQAAPVSLSLEQIIANEPQITTHTLSFPGPYAHFFVNGSTKTLYLSSTTAGLAAIDVSERYRFQERGRGLNSPANQFIIYKDQYAYIQATEVGSKGDLIILNVKDPEHLYEVGRIPHAIAQVTQSVEQTWYQSADLPTYPPSLGDYEAILQGEYQFGTCESIKPVYPENRHEIECDEEGHCTALRRFIEPIHEACFIDGKKKDVDERQDTLSGDYSTYDPMGSPVEGNPIDLNSDDSSGIIKTGSGGGSGSRAQMIILDDRLYVMSSHLNAKRGYLTTFDLTNPIVPTTISITTLKNAPEALVVTDHILYTSGKTAISMLSLADKNQPRILGTYTYPNLCSEPGAVHQALATRGSMVYRTQSASSCAIGETQALLQTFDFNQPLKPTLRSTISLIQPFGISAFGNYLFVADEASGISVFDIQQANFPQKIGTLGESGVQDVVLHQFDLYTLSPDRVDAHYIAPLYQNSASNPPIPPQRLDEIQSYAVIRPE